MCALHTFSGRKDGSNCIRRPRRTVNIDQNKKMKRRQNKSGTINTLRFTTDITQMFLLVCNLPSTFYLKGEISSIWIMLGFKPGPLEANTLAIAAWSLELLMKQD